MSSQPLPVSSGSPSFRLVWPPPLGWLAAGLVAGLVVALVSGGAPRPSAAADPTTTPEPTITVSGTGRVVMSPDVADLRLGVTVTRPTAAAARDAAATTMAAVVAAIEKAGVAEKDIQTATLSLSPVYEPPQPVCDGCPPGGGGRISGYQLTNIVAVTVRDLRSIGRIIDGAVAAGATEVSGIGFRVADPGSATAQARAAAVADARARAEALARAAGVSIVGVQSIAETSAPEPIPLFREAAPAAGPVTPVEPGSVDVTVTVTIVYRIG
jgi:uncharacterized protein YggE